MDNLKISLGQVSDCAAKIRSCNNEMFEDLSRIRKEMDNTSVSWMSDGAEAIRSRFNQFASRFEQQKELIDTYARFLDRTVESYDSLETTITSNAQGIQA
ncbi:MAG: pore-forming ESAT-6 family protein [Solobacterium sp.]|nr:pore-forming ESAT-6 family protein [Solobacterium sp.]MBR3347689.1 pore-forming ESAT-6 family protein [Solobacterium sp.]